MRPSARFLLLSSAATAVLFTALLVVVYRTTAGGRLDSVALEGLVSIIDSQRAVRLTEAVVRLCDPVAFAIAAAAIVAAALVRRSPARAIVAAALLFGSAATTQLLKPALATVRVEPTVDGWYLFRPVIGGEAFPSGHATAAMALALAALIVAPAVARPIVAGGGALFALAVGFGTVALGWHFPSDVVGGYLVATTWCLLALAALRAAQARGEPGREPAQGPARPAAVTPTAVAPAVALLAAATGAAIVTADRVADFAVRHTTAAAAAVAMSLCAAALVAAVSLADGRPR